MRDPVDTCLSCFQQSFSAAHALKRDVPTVRFDQVKRPVYQSSGGRWRTYERRLGPLLAASGKEVEGMRDGRRKKPGTGVDI